MNLYAASNQWANRPDDERFSSLEEMYDQTKSYATQARELEVPFSTLRVEAVDSNLQVTSRAGVPATFTHYAFDQLCTRVKAPASYLRELPPTLAAQNINYGLARRGDDGNSASLLFHQNGGLTLRALTTSAYERIWNWEIVEFLMRIRDEQGWRVPPARPVHQGQPGSRRATEADVLKSRSSALSVEVGDWIAPAGLYASDHDMFAFMVNEEIRVDDGSAEGLMRGFFIRQSEVGECSVWVTGFKMRTVCGNHIVWGVTDLLELKIKHVGEARKAVGRDVPGALLKYAQASVGLEQEQVNKARTLQLGTSKELVIEGVQKFKIPELSKKKISDAYDLAEMHVDQDGSPRTVWGIVNGFTRLSQQTTHADERNSLDRAAGKIMKAVF